MKLTFGTDGIRGRAGEWPITEATARRVGAAAVGAYGSRILLARDTRPSGAALVAALASGVRAAGGHPLDADVLPTSGLAFALEADIADAGVMVTASHNAAPDNGFKVFGPGGHKLVDPAMFEDFVALTSDRGTDGDTERVDVWPLWQATLLEHSDGLKGPIAFDLANGAATPARGWLAELCEAVFVGVDGVINDGCGSQHPARLQQAVVEHGCRAGIAVDGDADRCVLVDEQGRVVPGDALAWLLAKRLSVASMAVTVMSNFALEPALPGVRVVRTAVGDRHLKAAMEAEGLPLGCEESGHVLFDGIIAGDGLLTGLRALTGLHVPLSEAIAGFVPLPRATAKVRVGSRPALESVEALQAARKAGLARLEPGGRVFLRYSGTEPVLRILVEGIGDVDAIAADVAEAAGVLA